MPETLADAYDAHAHHLYAFARRLVGDEAEECVQEVFVSLAERGLAGVEDVRAYLFSSLRHAARARVQQGRRRAELHQRAAPLDEAHAADPQGARELARALAGLPLEQREVVALKVDGGLTFAEIGAVLGVPLNTAASRYRYALSKLKERLAP
jgi:RNA polymerase sigma-70 factor (ECF subfamily)